MATKKIKKSASEIVLESWLRQKLRRISYQFPERQKALANARVERGMYRCKMCEDAGIDATYGRKEIQVDHIEPVISIESGFIDWNDYIARLFCKADNLQILCKSCHQIKSYLENDIRKQIKAEKNAEKEDDI